MFVGFDFKLRFWFLYELGFPWAICHEHLDDPKGQVSLNADVLSGQQREPKDR